MFSLFFCAELGSSAARSFKSFLAPLAKVLRSFPSTLLTFYFCSKYKFRAAFFPCDCGASPHGTHLEELSRSCEEMFSLSSLYALDVWQPLFSGCWVSALHSSVPPERWPFSALTWHSSLVLCCSVHWRQLHSSSNNHRDANLLSHV